MNVTAIKLEPLKGETRLLFTLLSLADGLGRFQMGQDALARYIGSTRQTVSHYLHAFVKAKILKCKYSGRGIFNPEFTFAGSDADKLSACAEYKAFPCDMEE